MEAGGHRSASGRGPVEALAGQIITSNPGEVHDGIPLSGTTRRWRMVHVSQAAMSRLIGQQARVELTRPVLTDRALWQAIEQTLRLWPSDAQSPADASEHRWEEALTQACGRLVQCHGQGQHLEMAAPGNMALARECLIDRISDPPDLDELATLSACSRFQLVRQFAKAYGMPPFAWLLQYRLALARVLIAKGTSLGEAAYACGFADQSHLNRHFARCFGFTPGQWQRACHRPPLQ